MNNRQAGAFREMIRKEEKARENWLAENGARFGLTDGAIESAPVPQQQEAPLEPQQRTMEMPYVRKVRVPVTTQRMVPVKVQKKVPTRRLVEVPGYKEVEEQYTTVEQRPAVRKKEIWVKKVVPERYIKRTEVPRVRKVRVPSTLVKEVDDYSVVDMVEHRPVVVEGYRIDEIHDTKMVDVDEYQKYQMSQAVGPARVTGRSPSGTGRRSRTRVMGQEVYHPNDDRVKDLVSDYPSPADPSSGQVPRALSRSGRFGNAGASMIKRSGSRQGSAKKRSGTMSLQPNRPMAPAAPIGLRLGETGASGVLVQRVSPGGAGERAGVRVHDIVMYANNRPTRSLQEFKDIAASCNGPLYLQIVRRGAGKLKLTIIR